MLTVAISKRGLVRKITAEIEVMALMKLTTSAATIAGRISGRITRRTVTNVPARSVAEASSRLGSIWLNAARPARMLVVMSRNTKQATRMSPEYASSIGGALKARI